MKTYSFKVVLEPDEDAVGNAAWYAYCPALESVGGATSGRTREEALSKINEVIHMIVQEFTEEGKALPEGRRILSKSKRSPRSSPVSPSPSRPWPSTTVAFGRSPPEN
jgi:predicted RNase H-like HicB family nuclease